MRRFRAIKLMIGIWLVLLLAACGGSVDTPSEGGNSAAPERTSAPAEEVVGAPTAAVSTPAPIPTVTVFGEEVSADVDSLTLSAPGTFKNGSILWAGVRPCDALTDYQSRLAAALREAGFPLEEAEYRPHITLARQVRSALPDLSVPEIPFPVTHATLFESTRIDGVLSYIPLYRSAFR